MGREPIERLDVAGDFLRNACDRLDQADRARQSQLMHRKAAESALRSAHAFGVSVREIERVTGLSRSVVGRIVAQNVNEPAGGPTRSDDQSGMAPLDAQRSG